MFPIDLITGTLVNYYATCKREAWLYSRQIHADQNDDNVLMGKTLAELKETKLQDFPFSHLKFDRIEKRRGHYLITEHKKSMKNPEAAKMQLLFYLYTLKIGLKLKAVNGKVVSGRKTILVEGNEANMQKMEVLMDEMSTFLGRKTPPPVEYKKICDGCAYRTYCF